MKSRVLITGAAGQLGRTLLNTQSENVEVIGVDHAQCDIEDPKSIARAFEEYEPTVVINAAAFANVDRAESQPERAFAINATGVRNLAAAALRHDARLIHISTDYVFDGRSASPYPPDAAVNPLNIYGASKAAGEREFLASGVTGAVVRTAWLFSAESTSFVNKVLQQIRAGNKLRFVSDQIGTPTSTFDLAPVLLRLAIDDHGRKGVFHYTSGGSGSRYDQVMCIQQAALKLGIIDRPVEIEPVTSAAYNAAAVRPAYSVLDSRELWRIYGTPPNWKSGIETVLKLLG